MTKLTDRELFHFCEQFAIILRSGISCMEGLQIFYEDSKNKRSKEIFASLLHDMEETGSLATSLKNTGLFPDTFVTYVQVGEETGCLDEIMDSLAHHYEQESEISEQIRSAISYPLLMLGMMGVVIVILLVRVLPVFQQVFRQMGMEMNGLSQHLLAAGNNISRYSIVFLVIAALLVGFLLFLFLHPYGRKLATRVVSVLPGLREIPISRDYGRLTQGLSVGLRSGLGPDISMELAKGLVTHPLVRERLNRACELLSSGELFVDALSDSELFQGMDARLISLGFQAGAADEVMQKLSKRYEEASLAHVSRVISYVEPTIVILLSILVGLVLLSVMMPLLGLLAEMG
jgi:type IV pilus assembly protein PilC